jgi:hypothetical protein
MKEQTSILTTDDRVPNSVTYEEFSKSFESLLDTTNTNSSSTTDNGSLIQTHTILPFMTKSGSPAIYSIDKENDEKNV